MTATNLYSIYTHTSHETCQSSRISMTFGSAPADHRSQCVLEIQSSISVVGDPLGPPFGATEQEPRGVGCRGSRGSLHPPTRSL